MQRVIVGVHESWGTYLDEVSDVCGNIRGEIHTQSKRAWGEMGLGRRVEAQGDMPVELPMSA